ncbi:hypothetical protein [Mucilaginibacter gotjawali]|uniref:Uncharacterized protein n=2 Tax=Mucilaginibacter gotjawali TaxID=1550579 RepID=A0A0X8X5R2_9SPHI|nr:hypothetical protein [Mucilaginibacter gotjawali]MBB3055252.1 hypothetical protein [Mucilaginibacter gotjawali]BAU56129.1 hypothetical protein MgSA37_04326 [Mucilaginibacter gotjawali]
MESIEAKTIKKIRKWPFVFLGIILLIAGAGYYFYNQYVAGNRWKPVLQKRLKELVLSSSDSLYHIEYSDFDLNITSGNATLSDFRLIPDTAVYEKLVRLKKAPDNLFILSVKKLSIKNIGARKAYYDKILDIDNITIENPSLTIIDKRYHFNDTVKVGKPKTPYQIMKKVFKQLRIDSISLKDISLNYINKNKPVTKQTELKHLDIDISDVFIDSLSGSDSSRFYYTKGVNVTVHDYHIATPDGLYDARAQKIYFSTSERKIVLDNLSLSPRYNRDDFYKQTGKTGDIFTLKFKKIDINDIDLQDFLRAQVLYAGVMNISKPDVQIYTNNAYKGKKGTKIGMDPQQALQKVALDMRIKRINIKNARISYSETDKITNATGEILFTHTNGYILNVTNDDDQKKRNPYMRAFIDTRFMDAAPFSVNFKFNLVAKDGAFNYSGELGKFDGKVLDKLVKPLAMVHIQSADIEKLDFNVNASNYAGKGDIKFYYKNLKIQLLKKVEGKNELQKLGFFSALANNLILEQNNPGKDSVLRPGPIDLKREPDVSFFSFLYKALLDGLKPSVGYDKKTESQVNTTIVKVSNLVNTIKEFKEKRKERRAARKMARQAKRDSLNKIKENKGN